MNDVVFKKGMYYHVSYTLCKKTQHGDAAANLEETVTSSRFGSVILQPLQFAGISPIKDWFLSIATNGQKLLCKALIVWGILVVRFTFEWEHELLRKYVCGPQLVFKRPLNSFSLLNFRHTIPEP